MAPLMSSPMDSLRSSDVRDYEIRKMIAKITKIVERFLRHLIPEEKKEKNGTSKVVTGAPSKIK
ncbi:hypothetical protein Ancab_038087 [Ancistrocladus abbreviatus]